MAGRIKIPPYKPLDVRTSSVLGGGYIHVDANAGSFGPSPLAQLGLQVAEGAAATAAVVSEYVGRNDEATVKTADVRLGEAEQALLFDTETGYLNARGETALKQAPDVIEAYSQFQQREIAAVSSDEQQRMLEELAQRRLKTFGEVVERHGAAERLRWHDTARERRIEQMLTDAALHWGNDALVRRALGTVRADVLEQAEQHHWDQALTEMALRRQTSRTLVSAIGAAVEHDPGRAQSLRTRYDAHIEDKDRTALDALLSEAHTRERAQAASTELLNATPPEGEQPTPQWRLRQAEAIAEPAVRTATIRHLKAAAAAEEARARTLAEQVLTRVLKDGLTDSSQIPVREWVTHDAERRQAIETRLDHNARGSEPAPYSALVDELATEMTQAPATFARRDLVSAVAQLPMHQWQRFRDWQAGIRRNDPTTEGQLYAIKRGLQLAEKMLPSNLASEDATNYRAELVQEIDTWCNVNGESPDDADIAGMFERHVVPLKYVPTSPDADPHPNAAVHHLRDTTGQTDYHSSRSRLHNVRNTYGQGFRVEFAQNGEIIGTIGTGLQPRPDAPKAPGTTVRDPRVGLAQADPHTPAPTPSNENLEPACVVAASICMMSAPPPDGAQQCMQAEEACGRGVATVRAAQAAGATNVEGLFSFPDGTYVVVSRILGVPPGVVPNGQPPAWRR